MILKNLDVTVMDFENTVTCTIILKKCSENKNGETIKYFSKQLLFILLGMF